jgi:hypothetical protein
VKNGSRWLVVGTPYKISFGLEFIRSWNCDVELRVMVMV